MTVEPPLDDLDDADRIQLVMPSGAHPRLEQRGPKQWRATFRLPSRIAAVMLWEVMAVEPIAVARVGKGFYVRPWREVSREMERGELHEEIWPLVWRLATHEPSQRHLVTLRWWIRPQLRANEGSLVSVECLAAIAKDPAWLAGKHIKGIGDTILEYHWEPREFPRGHTFVSTTNVSRETPPIYTVWFPRNRLGPREALGVA